MIKRVEVNYRGIFQKNLGKKIGSDIVMIASPHGQGRRSRTGATATRRSATASRASTSRSSRPICAEEELEAECGAKLDIDEADVSVVLDDTMVKGVEPWGWHGVRPINEKVVDEGLPARRHRGTSRRELLQFIGSKPYPYRMATSRATRAWPASGCSRTT